MDRPAAGGLMPSPFFWIPAYNCGNDGGLGGNDGARSCCLAFFQRLHRYSFEGTEVQLTRSEYRNVIDLDKGVFSGEE